MNKIKIIKNINVSKKWDINSQHYPKIFRSNKNYFIGDENVFNNTFFRIGIIGTRKPSDYGVLILKKLLSRLKLLNILTVSGGALGIDSWVHKISIEKVIPTLSVLVGPIEKPSPQSNSGIFQRISTTKSCGLLVPGCLQPSVDFKLYRSHWLERNQWLVSMVDILVVVEAQVPSGTFSSVNAANRYNTPVYIFPGAIGNKSSEGTNKMIALGLGEPISSIEEFIQLLRKKYSKIKNSLETDVLSQSNPSIIIEVLKRNQASIHLDFLLERLSYMPQADVLLELSRLTVQKLVQIDNQQITLL